MQKTTHLIINAVKRQKFHVHLSTALQLLGDKVSQTTCRCSVPGPPWGTSIPQTLIPNHGYTSVEMTMTQLTCFISNELTLIGHRLGMVL